MFLRTEEKKREANRPKDSASPTPVEPTKSPPRLTSPLAAGTIPDATPDFVNEQKANAGPDSAEGIAGDGQALGERVDGASDEVSILITVIISNLWSSQFPFSFLLFSFFPC